MLSIEVEKKSPSVSGYSDVEIAKGFVIYDCYVIPGFTESKGNRGNLIDLTRVNLTTDAQIMIRKGK